MQIKKVLYVTDIVGLGGGETSLLNHLDSLNRKEYMPTVLCSKSGMLTDKLLTIGIEVKIIKWRQAKKLAHFFIYYPFISFFKLLKFLYKSCFDIIHVNTFNSIVVIGPAAKLCNTPVVWTCHGWWPTGKITGIFINLFVSKTIAVSNFVKKKLQNPGNVHPSKIIQIPLGIEQARYLNVKPESIDSIKDEFNLPKDIPIVGMIGRYQKLKGHHVFIKMASEINKTHPNVCFMVIGSEVFGKASETAYGNQIKELIHDRALEKKVILTGFRDDIANILGALDVLVVPSEVETFGMVVLEAMASGPPVISCSKGGPTEIIHDGKNGFLIDGQDPVKMAKKVCYLIDNKEIGEKIKISAKQVITQKYLIKDQVSKIEAVYSDLLN